MKEFMEEIGQKDENKEISFEEFKNILTKWLKCSINLVNKIGIIFKLTN